MRNDGAATYANSAIRPNDEWNAAIVAELHPYAARQPDCLPHRDSSSFCNMSSNKRERRYCGISITFAIA